jgi:hypothetical protein
MLRSEIFPQTHFKPKVYHEPIREQYLRNLPREQSDGAKVLLLTSDENSKQRVQCS